MWQGEFSVHPLVSDDGLWGTVGGGSTFSFTFNSPGTFDYHCQVHQAFGMTGEVIIKSP
ncbi:MAG: plastocyanin/azurin family copper-binding protein [Anaerolineales bacterium]